MIIESQLKKNFNVTGVPFGNIIHEMIFDISQYIIGGKDDDDLDSVDSMVTLKVIQDEKIVSTFTLSRFCKDVLIMAVQTFPEEYGLDKNTVGPNSKLFIQKQVRNIILLYLLDLNTLTQCSGLVFVDGATKHRKVPSEFNGTDGDEAEDSEGEVADEVVVWTCKGRDVL